MKKISLLFFGSLIYQLLQAQENADELDLNLQIEENKWYASPWVWIIGAAIFILLLVALTRGKKEG
jgi:hypothetical protein